MLVREIYAKGQIVIPKELRNKFGIVPRTKMAFTVEDDRIILRKAEDILGDFVAIAKKGESIDKIDLDKEYLLQIEERYGE